MKITLKMVAKVIGSKEETVKRWPSKRKTILKLGVAKALELGIIPPIDEK